MKKGVKMVDMSIHDVSGVVGWCLAAYNTPLDDPTADAGLTPVACAERDVRPGVATRARVGNERRSASKRGRQGCRFFSISVFGSVSKKAIDVERL